MKLVDINIVGTMILLDLPGNGEIEAWEFWAFSIDGAPLKAPRPVEFSWLNQPRKNREYVEKTARVLWQERGFNVVGCQLDCVP